ncbi:sulfite exporter TauE/SafE family protein [Agrobacterium sp. O3.4]|uniref:Probable membrane transporter protein n=1 Tax=Agrobacterium cucumeris TaxID=2862866 RepID=A0ABY8RN99_9HYPH|nr:MULTISPECIES: sulfite exporter TauE/SafE family protein [Rhizobium/Agrobacterium group]MCZ7468207.1 sulfite exporter TauE/SafE family protein [Rhizobium rhizogenes]WHO08653.1 sulfite exporter TauE/SafE family protein [Agrobacterium cucumeris]
MPYLDFFSSLITAHSPSLLAMFAGAAFLAGLARGFSGFGAALIFIPLASAIVGPRIASAVLLVVDGVLTLGMIPPAFRMADRREVFTMAAGALVGVPLGTLLLSHSDPLTLRWIISTVVVVLLLFLLSGWRYSGRPKTPLTLFTGFLAGLFSGAAQLGGPPVVAYWLGGALKGAFVRANVILYFAVSTVISTASYFFGGLFTADVFVFFLLALPFYGAGLYAGARLHGFADEAAFRRICYGLIAISAVIGLPLFDSLLK